MPYLVKFMDNLTAYPTYRRGPTSRLIAKLFFESFAEALTEFNKRKSMLKFAGSPGNYYTYPVEVPEMPPQGMNECDDCKKFFTPDSDNELFCSRCNAVFISEKNSEYESGGNDYDGDDYDDCSGDYYGPEWDRSRGEK